MSEEDINYNKALEKSKNYHSDPEGLSRHIPSSQTDKILLKQNNTIIELLLDLHRKIDILIKGKETQKPLHKEPELPELHKKIDILINKETQPKNNLEIDELVNQLKRIELTPKQERKNIIRKPQKWTFYQIDGEPSKTTKDKEKRDKE